MSDRVRLSEALYRLGELRNDSSTDNRALLRRMVRIAADATGSEVTIGVVYEAGIGTEPTAYAIEGGASPQARSAVDLQTERTLADRTLMRRLATTEPGRLVRRSELGVEPVADTGGETWFARFERADGAEFVFAVVTPSLAGEAGSTRCARAGVLARYVGRTWQRVWTCEPRWLRDLRPAARRVLDLVVQGYDDEQISHMTGLTYHSVRAHLKRLFRQANVRSRLHLIQASHRAWVVVDDEFEFVSPAEAGLGAGSVAAHA